VCGGNCDCCSELCEADANDVTRCKKLGDPTCGSPNQVLLPDGELCETDCQCVSGLCAEPRPPDSGKSAVSRRFIKATKTQIEKELAEPLGSFEKRIYASTCRRAGDPDG
jgi:hypothetical protein